MQINTAVLGAYAQAQDQLYHGKLADYIPELKKANPRAFGVALLDPDGKYHHAGDVDELFTIQSISKVIALIAAIRTIGMDKVFDKVGVEPTGDPFNSIMKLETTAHVPFNPFINAGAHVISNILAANLPFGELLDYAGKLLNADLRVNEAVYNSEKQSGLRNRAMGYLLASKDMTCENVEEYLDYYFRFCAVEANAMNLAHMGLILAHNGENPITGARLIDDSVAKITKARIIRKTNAIGHFGLLSFMLSPP